MRQPDEPVWLPKQTIIDLHARSIELFGGSHGIREEAGIDAALDRPRQVLAYGDATGNLHELAAAMGFAFAKIRHPFVDGNKRVAWFSMFTFLRINGLYLDAPERIATEMMVGVASGERSEQDLAQFLQQYSYPEQQ